MPSPKTATITMTIVNDDGSKTIVETADLDATRLPNNRYSRPTDAAEHMVIGMVDPFHDESNWFERRDFWTDQFQETRLIPRETHFNLQLQLPPVNSSGHVYTIRVVEPPIQRVVMGLRRGKPEVQTLSEEEAAAVADRYDGLHLFFLDIP